MLKNLILLTALGSAAVTQAQTETSTNTLKIYTAIEVEFATATNKVYRLEGSSNFETWQSIGKPVYGNSATVSQVFSTRDAGAVSFDFYRLAISQSTNSSLAPWGFSGVTLKLSDDNFTEQLQFTSATTGSKIRIGDNDPFTYSFAKTAENEARAELRFSNGRAHVYTFTFTTPLLGSYVREEFVGAALDDRDLGTFSVTAGGQTPPDNGGANTNTVPTQRPAQLTGTAFVFNSGGTPDRLEFRTATTGIEFEHILLPGEVDDPDGFTYTYSLVSSNQATLVADYGDGKRDEFTLTFQDGASGSFVRREFRDGQLDDTDTGTFSPATSTPENPSDGGGTPPGGTAESPTSIVGATYIMNDGTADTLAFTTATAGTETDDDSFDSFSYTYTKTGPTTATLRVTFEPGKWDDYDLTFTAAGSGTFVRREYDDGGILDKTESGSFTSR